MEDVLAIFFSFLIFALTPEKAHKGTDVIAASINATGSHIGWDWVADGRLFILNSLLPANNGNIECFCHRFLMTAFKINCIECEIYFHAQCINWNRKQILLASERGME